MIKSTRHQKITGDFAEMLVLYWLSKSGYECARIDHTGVDIIAAARDGTRMGISVQCRSRTPGTENSSVNLHEFKMARVACGPFGCVPYSAIVVDRAGTISCYLLSLDYLESICRREVHANLAAATPRSINKRSCKRITAATSISCATRHAALTIHRGGKTP